MTTNSTTARQDRDPYEAAVAAIRANADDLALYLAVWAAREDPCLEPHARRCASDAVNVIDTIIAELHGIRGHLIPEMRASDDAAMDQADAMLRILREDDQ
jgi:hypothetical protein